MSRLRVPHVERLTARIAIGVSLLLLGPLAGGLYLLSAIQYDHAVAARRAAADIENRILETALRHDMLARDTALITGILQDVGRQPEVLRAMIIDHNGVIELSSRPAEVGVRTSRTSPTCLVCHTARPADRRRWVTFKENGADILRTVLPIENRQECHRCHDPGTRWNGMMVLDVSLAPVQAQFKSDVWRLGGGSAVVALLMLGGLGWHLRRVVLSRLSTLTRTARAIAGGALDERADTAGGDTIASLATDFNAMADATSRLVEEIKRREQQLSGVLNGLDDGLIVLGRDFKVVAANRSIATWLGSHPDALRGQECRRVTGHALPCCDDPECPAARCLATGRLAQATYRVPASEGRDERVYEIYASPVHAEDGSVGQVVEAWRDITDRVRGEEHLAEFERLSSLGILASGLSHEVNTPLATTLTCAEGILDQLPAAADGPPSAATVEAVRDSAAVIRDQVMRCRTITRQFLRFARGIPPATEPIDLGEVVDGVLSLALPAARAAEVELVRDSSGPIPVVSANTEVVQHVVLNLLVNAIESCGGRGGRVVVRFDVGEQVRLQVSDNGCGIPAEAQRHLFEPFRTEKPNGTGLGLFLSRRFMRRFGGDVRLVESTVGRGSCIEVVFSLSGAGAL